MRKAICISLCLISVVFAQAQTKTDSLSNAMGQGGNNELKINLLNALLGIPEINYERLIQDNMGLGIAAFVSVDKSNFEYNYGFIPHYRLYFGSKKASGFFIEGNLAFISVKGGRIHYDDYTNMLTASYQNKLNFGMGAAAGAKFLTRNGFLGEAYLGLGRFMGENRYVEAYPRIGITIGKRF